VTAADPPTRVVVTGAGGFVGPHLVAALRRIGGADVEIIATSKDAETHRLLGPLAALDVCDGAATAAAIARWRPTHVINLAGLASAAQVAADPEAAWAAHLQGARNLGRAILAEAPSSWLFQVGSGLVYGASGRSGEPVDERTLLAPLDEYAATKAAADMALAALVPAGLKCLRFRPFNHTGRGQSEAFVVPAFAMQVARIEAGLAAPILRVGNLDAERDLLDVADVVDAYALAIYGGDELAPGEIFNVATGRTRRVADLLDELLKLSRVEIAIERDPARYRVSDLPILVGDASRLRAKLGWAPRRALQETLLDVLEDCRVRVQAERSV
jgi:GDP-4-dehydro-6-deoxy-D-mannose reductase